MTFFVQNMKLSRKVMCRVKKNIVAYFKDGHALYCSSRDFNRGNISHILLLLVCHKTAQEQSLWSSILKSKTRE